MSNKSSNRKLRKPWPTKAAMSQIYEKNLWGGEDHDFYSGEGSHNPEFVKPYVEIVKGFLSFFTNPLTVCDLGCGDFNIGKELYSFTKKYVGIDIVPELIERNKEKFKADNLEFHCLDIAEDDLPEADCAILRQVLQHLSNAEVEKIAAKLSNYKYLILTEHIPEGDFTPNKDIISGQGNRLRKESGIDLKAPPFDFVAKDRKELLRIKSKKWEGVLVTQLYKIID